MKKLKSKGKKQSDVPKHTLEQSSLDITLPLLQREKQRLYTRKN